MHRHHIWRQLPCFGTSFRQNAKAEEDFEASDEDGTDDQDDDDPGEMRHLVVGDGVGEDFGQVEEDSATFVEDLDSRLDLEVFADGFVERVQGRFAVPEEIGDVEHVGSCGRC